MLEIRVRARGPRHPRLRRRRGNGHRVLVGWPTKAANADKAASGTITTPTASTSSASSSSCCCSTPTAAKCARADKRIPLDRGLRGGSSRRAEDGQAVGGKPVAAGPRNPPRAVRPAASLPGAVPAHATAGGLLRRYFFAPLVQVGLAAIAAREDDLFRFRSGAEDVRGRLAALVSGHDDSAATTAPVCAACGCARLPDRREGERNEREIGALLCGARTCWQTGELLTHDVIMVFSKY